MNDSMDIWKMELQAKSQNTRKQYLRAFKWFIEYADLTPESLFKLHHDALRSPDPRDHYKVSRLVKACMADLKEKGYASSTTYAVYKAVNSFLTSQGLEFKLHGAKPRVYSQGQRIIEKNEIKEMLEATGEIRNKAMILTLKDSGLRVSDLVKLRYDQVRNALESNLDFVLIRLRQAKNDIPAMPIIGPESLRAIQKWIEFRRRNGEEIQDTSFLFTKIEGEGKRQPLLSQSISTTIRKIVEKCGLKDVSAHSFRKFHTTMLQAGGVPESWIAIIQGRKINDSRSAYVHPSDSQLIAAYSEAYPALSLEETTRLEEYEKRLETYQEENLMLKQQLSTLQGELTQLRTELESYGYLRAIREGPDSAKKYGQQIGLIPPDSVPPEKWFEWWRQKGIIKPFGPDEDDEIIESESIDLTPTIDSYLEKKLDEMLSKRLVKPNNDYSYITVDVSDETQLLAHLEDGWEIYREINGKIILRK